MFDFPGTPTNGQMFTPVAGGPSYVFQSPVWRLAAGGVNPGFWVGDAPPSSPVQGTLWWESDTGNSFIWYDDGSSGQWVQFNIAPPSADTSVLLPEQAAAPATLANFGALYTKDVAGKTELFYRLNDSGAETQITRNGILRGARQTAIFNFSGAASPWAFRGFPPGVIGFDIIVTNAIAAAAGLEFYSQIVNSAGVAVTSGYRGAYQVGNAAPLITPAGYPKLSGTIAASTGVGGIVQWRKGSLYWTYTSMFSLLGGINQFYAAGDLPAAVDDPQGFNFGLVTAGVINGGNCRVDYWTD